MLSDMLFPVTPPSFQMTMKTKLLTATGACEESTKMPAGKAPATCQGCKREHEATAPFCQSQRSLPPHVLGIPTNDTTTTTTKRKANYFIPPPVDIMIITGSSRPFPTCKSRKAPTHVTALSFMQPLIISSLSCVLVAHRRLDQSNGPRNSFLFLPRHHPPHPFPACFELSKTLKQNRPACAIPRCTTEKMLMVQHLSFSQVELAQ
jgi:hypothetical protein